MINDYNNIGQIIYLSYKKLKNKQIDKSTFNKGNYIKLNKIK